jgi:hypothetical protein
MMSMRNWLRTAGFALATTLIAVPASAQIVQSFNVGFGVFYPRSFDSRDVNDTLVANKSAAEPLAFDIGSLSAATVFGEWIVEMGPHLSFGASVGYYSEGIPSTYVNVVNANGAEILQDLRLRVTPITGVVRFSPFGSAKTFQPYIGVGVSALPFRYSESGQFVDTSDNSIFTDRFVATGTGVGPVVLGGFRAPVGGDIYALTMEWRYQFGTGDTGGLQNGFLGDKIDLSGGNLNFGFLIRF